MRPGMVRFLNGSALTNQRTTNNTAQKVARMKFTTHQHTKLCCIINFHALFVSRTGKRDSASLVIFTLFWQRDEVSGAKFLKKFENEGFIVAT